MSTLRVLHADIPRLLDAARDGSVDAQNQLLVLLSDYLNGKLENRQLRGRSPSRSNCDFVQDTLLRVQHGLKSFSGECWEDLTLWTWRILYRRHQETRRNRRTRTNDQMLAHIWRAYCAKRGISFNGSLSQAPETQLAVQEEVARAVTLFRSVLKPHEQNIIELHLMRGFRFKEIAALVNKSTDCVRKAYQRAIRKLRVELEFMFR